MAQLEAFYWTVHLGSTGRAAQHLNISQPTISLRLKDLNAAVGADLLERNGRRLEMTAEGRALLPRINAVMAELREFDDRDPTADLVGQVRIGLAEGFAVTCLPPLSVALAKDHPAMRPEWVVSTSTSLERGLLADTLDLAVLLNPIADDRMQLTPLGAQPTSWVAPAAWQIAARVTPKDLQMLPVISNPQPSAMHRQITGWFATAGLEPRRLSTCTSVAVIAELVDGGIGAGLLPIRMAQQRARQGRMQFLRTDPPVQNGRLYVGIRTGVDDPKARAVSRTLVQVLKEIDYLQTET